MRGMFGRLDLSDTITTLDVSNWDTSNVTNMDNMFYDNPSIVNLDIASWNVTSLRQASNFLIDSDNALTTAQYDAVLIAWAAQSLQSNVTIHFGDAQYTAGGAAESARNTLVSTYGWTITDGGAV
jgi:surface protein